MQQSNGERCSSSSPGRLRLDGWGPRLVLAVLVIAGGLLIPGFVHAQGGHLFATIPAVELQGGGVVNAFSGLSLFCEAFCFPAASARLPHGARLLGVEIDACRDASGDWPIEYGVVRRLPHEQIHPSTGTSFEILFSGTFDTVGCAYHQVAPPAPIAIDLFESEVLVFVNIGTFPCGIFGSPACPDQGSRVQALRVYYQANSDGGVVEPSKRSAFPIFP